MKRLFFVAFMLVGLEIVLAEESGGFVGLEVGYGEAEITHIRSTAPYKNENIFGADFSGGGVAYGFTLGYKQFFTPYFGLRYYVNVNALHATLKPYTTAEGESADNLVNAKKSSVTLLNYGANIDFLANVLASESVDLGGFVGLGIGGDSWLGKGVDYQLEIWKPNDWKIKDKTMFNVWINVGIRANIAKNHSIELVARVPFLKAKLLDNYIIGAQTNEVKVTLKGIYTISVRYAFSF